MKPGNKETSRFSVDQLVKDFLEFFQSRNHHFIPSAPLLPEDLTVAELLKNVQFVTVGEE